MRTVWARTDADTIIGAYKVSEPSKRGAIATCDTISGATTERSMSHIWPHMLFMQYYQCNRLTCPRLDCPASNAITRAGAVVQR